MHEIQKALQKALEQVVKYRADVVTISEQHQTLLWKHVNTTPPAEYLPDIDGILSSGSTNGVANFKIGHEVTPAPLNTNATNSLLLNSMQTTSIIQDNEQLRKT